MIEVILITLLMLATAVCFSPHPSTGLDNLQRRSKLHRLKSFGGLQPENEEPLLVIFQRAVVLQRSGDHRGALKDYELFLKAARQCDVSPEMYAEVHVNIGAVCVKDSEIDLARHHFELALEHRQVGTAHVNLALILLREGSRTMDPRAGVAALEGARGHCETAVQLGDSEQSKSMATSLLRDIKGMLEKMI